LDDRECRVHAASAIQCLGRHRPVHSDARPATLLSVLLGAHEVHLPEVRAESRQAEAQQLAVVAGGGRTGIRAFECPQTHQVGGFGGIGQRADGIPAAGQVCEGTGADESAELARPEPGALQLGHAENTEFVGRCGQLRHARSFPALEACLDEAVGVGGHPQGRRAGPSRVPPSGS